MFTEYSKDSLVSQTKLIKFRPAACHPFLWPAPGNPLKLSCRKQLFFAIAYPPGNKPEDYSPRPIADGLLRRSCLIFNFHAQLRYLRPLLRRGKKKQQLEGPLEEEASLVARLKEQPVYPAHGVAVAAGNGNGNDNGWQRLRSKCAKDSGKRQEKGVVGSWRPT